ncbi:Alpha/Beta hydrolase fold [Lasallia pustulata]|uniref:Alpha/Beta hydrolase fold n=1 Tax=Lasallia pustulata TaxID=136370 RepID=A0A1W5D5W2_9LECA|nr:Alpha/Beta hydrolase fold [Lasallia pustulata]
MSKMHPEATCLEAVAWQVENHQGFVKAYMSSMRNSPIYNQHEDWKRTGRRLTTQSKLASSDGEEQGLKEGKVLLIAGEEDEAIIKDDIFADAMEAFEGNVVLQAVDAGHDFPITRAIDAVEMIWQFWSSGDGK